jgi:hypothetical protein
MRAIRPAPQQGVDAGMSVGNTVPGRFQRTADGVDRRGFIVYQKDARFFAFRLAGWGVTFR